LKGSHSRRIQQNTSNQSLPQDYADQYVAWRPADETPAEVQAETGEQQQTTTTTSSQAQTQTQDQGKSQSNTNTQQAKPSGEDGSQVQTPPSSNGNGGKTTSGPYNGFAT